MARLWIHVCLLVISVFILSHSSGECICVTVHFSYRSYDMHLLHEGSKCEMLRALDCAMTIWCPIYSSRIIKAIVHARPFIKQGKLLKVL